MEKKDLLEIVHKIDTVDKLKKYEDKLVDGVRHHIAQELKRFGDSIDSQDITNKCVNAIAATLRTEIGLMDAEGAKVLERIRLVSDRTVQRDKKEKKK